MFALRYDTHVCDRIVDDNIKCFLILCQIVSDQAFQVSSEPILRILIMRALLQNSFFLIQHCIMKV